MPAYRHYRLDGAGNIRSAEWLEAADDEDAVRKVRELGPRQICEIWQRNRLVVRLDPSTDE